MNRFTIILMMAVMAVTAAAQDIQHHVVNVGDFTHLVVDHSINVEYKSSADSAGLAVFDARPEMVNTVMFSNNGKGKLTVKTDTEDVIGWALPTVKVYSRHLFTVENKGDSTVLVLKASTSNKFKASLEGNGRLSVRDIETDEVQAKIFTGRGQVAVAGKCAKANLSCTGVGTIQADNLIAVDVVATLNGPCNIGCHVDGELTVKGVGNGTLYYSGEPKLIKNRALGCNLQPIGK
ncbi:MAG: DUF2807 domain-containing protein [Muribaculaceae bacterium]|nr:DUF2807 domain-containing protein [Muribaculaceae bacterium]